MVRMDRKSEPRHPVFEFERVGRHNRNDDSSDSDEFLEAEEGEDWVGGGEGEDDGGDEGSASNIEAEFDALTPSDNHIPMIENLMKQWLKFTGIDVRALAELLVETNYVTTILMSVVDNGADAHSPGNLDDEETLYGVFSAVSLKARKDNPAIKKLVEVALQLAQNIVDGEQFKEILTATSDDIRPGWLIVEKVLNVPERAIPMLIRTVLKDMQTATSKGMPYDFTHFIYVTKMLRLASGEDYFVQEMDEMLQDKHLRFLDADYPEDVDADLTFETEEGVQNKGTQFRRIYLLTKDHVLEWFAEMASVPEVQALAGLQGISLTV